MCFFTTSKACVSCYRLPLHISCSCGSLPTLSSNLQACQWVFQLGCNVFNVPCSKTIVLPLYVLRFPSVEPNYFFHWTARRPSPRLKCFTLGSPSFLEEMHPPMKLTYVSEYVVWPCVQDAYFCKVITPRGYFCLFSMSQMEGCGQLWTFVEACWICLSSWITGWQRACTGCRNSP